MSAVNSHRGRRLLTRATAPNEPWAAPASPSTSGIRHPVPTEPARRPRSNASRGSVCLTPGRSVVGTTMFTRLTACCAGLQRRACPMTPLKRFAAGMAVAALVAGGAACTNDDPVAEPTTPPPTTSTTPSPSRSASPTPTPTLSQRQQAEVDAIAMVKKYYALSDKLAAKPPGVSEAKRQLQAVATSDELAYTIADIGQLRAAKERQTGMVAVLKPQIETINPTFKPRAQPPRTPVVKVRVCPDVSDLDLFDSSGKSLANPKRQMRRVSHVEVVNAGWPSRSGWRVRDILDEATSC